MPQSFDPSSCVRFDLNRGAVRSLDGQNQLLVPAGALAALVSGVSDGRSFGRALGLGLMGRVVHRLSQAGGRFGTMPPGVSATSSVSSAGDTLRRAPFEDIVEFFGGEVALAGLGSLRIERWGQALLFVLEPCTLDARADPLLAGVFEGAVSMAAARDVRALVVERTASSARVLCGNGEAIADAEHQLAEGAFFTDIIARLHGERRGG